MFDLMVRMKRETCGQEPQVRTQIDTLVIMDREVDLISPLPLPIYIGIRYDFCLLYFISLLELH